MKRTTNIIKTNRFQSLEYLQVVGSLVARMELANKMGTQQYGGDRDMTQALGYKETITYADYYARYKRQDMAKAIIDRPVKSTWQGGVEIIEADDDKETKLEKAWVDLEDKLHITSVLSRLDRLTGIGRYGILLLGLGDVPDMESFAKPAKSKELHYLQPFSEGSAEIKSYEENPLSARFGQPEFYELTIAGTAGNNNIKVHHSRVLHIVDDPLESEVEGSPKLEVVFNRLMDLEKIVGGDAEMFWRGARPGYQGLVDKDFQATTTTKENLRTQIDEMEHNLRRLIVNEGVKFEALEQQISDPKNHVDIQIQMISAVTRIPKRILTGSERGELSSAQDADEWKTFIQNRREDYAEVRIIRPFVDRLISLGVLPKSQERYSVKWQDLFAISEKEQVAIGKERSTSLKEYASNPLAQEIVPPPIFLEYFLGLPQDKLDMVLEMLKEAIKEEEKLNKEADKALEESVIEPVKKEEIKIPVEKV